MGRAAWLVSYAPLRMLKRHEKALPCLYTTLLVY